MTTRLSALPRATRSVCPLCLRRIDATYVHGDAPGSVLLRKTCPEHGEFSALVWRISSAATSTAGAAGVPTFARWSRPKNPSPPLHPATSTQRGCPFDCGLCPGHAQHTCTGLLEVTTRCDMHCPVCYAAAGQQDVPSHKTDPPLDELRARLDALYRDAGPCNVQLSGGEPTLRQDLPLLAAHARSLGFALVQVNTNGLRLAREPAYAHELRKAGVDSVYLQWDGVRAESFLALRGQACAQEKHAALRHCVEAGLGVILVATLVRGVNDSELGDLLRLAVHSPGVRGLHLQPVAAFGRSPWPPSRAPRLTLPEIMERLAAQAPQWVQAQHFHPPGCEHELCSCSALYLREGEGDSADLRWLPAEQSCCAAETADSGTTGSAPPRPTGPLINAAEGARKARAFVAKHWGGQSQDNTPLDSSDTEADAFEHFVRSAGAGQRFTLSAMAFQDALSLDLARTRGCCIHIVERGGRRIPFCLYNLTAEDGTPLYRGRFREPV